MPKRVQLGFLVIAMLPVILGMFAIRNALRLVDATERVAVSNNLVKEVERMLSSLKDVEVAQRDFIISGDEHFVRQIEASRRHVQTQISRLEKLETDERWLGILRMAVPQKFDEIRDTVRLRQEGDLTAAQALVLQDRGQKAMDDIRRVAQALVREENYALQKGTSDESRNLVNTMAVFVAVLILNVVLVYGIFWLTRREARTVLEMNRMLERRVALRTAELQRSNEDLQRFAYVASHDIKEPMRMISSYAALLQRRYQGRLDEDANTWINFMIDGVRRMDQLVTGLLEYSRAGQEKAEQASRVDSEQVFGSVLENLQALIHDTGAVVTHDPLPPVDFDSMRLCQLLQNLVGNAIKYRSLDRRPEVHVSAAERDGAIVFSVTDNGQGIAPEHQDQVFGLFKRLHGKDVEGTGIGLATCRRIVERNGGMIWLESAPGSGSTFFFSVPLQSRSAASRAAG